MGGPVSTKSMFLVNVCTLGRGVGTKDERDRTSRLGISTSQKMSGAEHRNSNWEEGWWSEIFGNSILTDNDSCSDLLPLTLLPF